MGTGTCFLVHGRSEPVGPLQEKQVPVPIFPRAPCAVENTGCPFVDGFAPSRAWRLGARLFFVVVEGDEDFAGFGAAGGADDSARFHQVDEASGARIADVHAALEE
jgi:hypothetical protein